MADKDTLNLIKFKFGSFQSIKDLSSKDQSSFYFASDAPAFYNAGLWYGVSSLTSSVDEETGEVTLVINGGFGNNWESSQVEHKFVAGMTKQQKTDLEKAVSFVDTVTSTKGEDTQTIIDKWNEIVAFLAGFKETDVLLDRISTIENEVDDLKETTIAAGDGLTGGGNLSANRTIGLGKPSTITDSSTNSATGNTHTHAIDEASTEQRGIVRLNDTLTSTSTDQALTANQGRVLKEHIDDMFELIDKGNGIKEIKAKYGLWSDSFISARGVDEESGGVGGLDAQAVWDLLMQNDDATKIINVAHIPDITIAKITDIANASVANAKTLDGVALNRFPYIYGYKGSLDLNTYVDGENKFYSLFIGAGHSSIPSGATYSTLLNVAGYNADTSFQLIGCQFQDKLYYRGGSSSPDSNNYIFNKDWKQIAFRETTLSGYGITDAVTLNTAQTISGVKTFSGGISILGGSTSEGKTSVEFGSSSHYVILKSPLASTGGWSRGYKITAIKADNTTEEVLYSAFGSEEKIQYALIALPNQTYSTATFKVYSDKAAINNNVIWHAGNLSPVTTNTDQTIGGVKTFSNGIKFGSAAKVTALNSQYLALVSGGNEVILTGGKETLYINSKTIDGAVLPSIINFCNGSTSSYASVKAKGFTSTVDTGTAPFAVKSTTMVTNLNAEMVGGLRAANFTRAIHLNQGEVIPRNIYSVGYIVGMGVDGETPKGDGGGYLASVRHDGYGGHLFIANSGSVFSRGVNNSVVSSWKQLAFTDTNTLTPNGGTLNINGNLKVSNQLTIGNATLYWDVANQCLRVNAGIASDSFLSAKGIDTTGNGQGGGGGFDATMLWNELTISSPTNTGKTIMLDLLPDIPTNKVTDFANQVKALITVENIPTLTSAKISDFNTAVATAMSSTLSDISANLSNHEQRLQAIERALTWQGI